MVFDINDGILFPSSTIFCKKKSDQYYYLRASEYSLPRSLVVRVMLQGMTAVLTISRLASLELVRLRIPPSVSRPEQGGQAVDIYIDTFINNF